MPVCVPVKDMKDTAKFAKIVEQARGPVTVTRNGYDAFVVMRSEDFEAMQLELAKARLLTRVAQAENEYATGHFAEGPQAIAALREAYGL